jgi:acylphosphatase
MVQGVGFRYFTQAAAEKLRIHGFVRNLRDGRVEVFAMAPAQQQDEFRAMLERGPRFSRISEVQEETAAPDPQYEGGFVINPSA